MILAGVQDYEHAPEQIESCGARGFVRKEHLPRVDFGRFWPEEQPVA